MNLRLALIAFTLPLLLSCGSTSPYTSATGGSVPVGTNSFLVTAGNAPNSYTINGGSNPSLTMQRGKSYSFNLNVSGHPFYIMIVQGTDTTNAFTNGVTGNGTTNGTLTFFVPQTAPSTLFYDCSNHLAMSGVINITN